MAVLTTQTKPLLMDVIPPVTGMAITGSCLEYRSQMTLFAWSYRMHSVQRKAGHGMIETDLSTPTICIMAVTTLLAFLSLVDIIRRMTAVAACFQVFRGQLTTMT